MSDTFTKKNQAQLLKQETFIVSSLQLNEQEHAIQDRVLLAKYIAEIELALMSEEQALFNKRKEITPVNLVNSLQELIVDCQEIAVMATTMAPLWSFDRIKFFLLSLEEILVFGDASFKQNGVFLKKIILAAQERFDMAALADLFSGECQSLLRYLLNQVSNKNKK